MHDNTVAWSLGLATGVAGAAALVLVAAHPTLPPARPRYVRIAARLLNAVIVAAIPLSFLAGPRFGSAAALAFVVALAWLMRVPYRSSFWRLVPEIAGAFVIVGVPVVMAGMLLLALFVKPYYIASEDMEPALLGHEKGMSPTGMEYTDTVHDQVLVYRLGYILGEPRRGDIVVFRAEKKADTRQPPRENVLVKRLIGLPGDTVAVRPDAAGVVRLFLNGKPLDEPYIREEMAAMPGARYAIDEPLKLGPKELFLLGDNRNNSNDSRYWGPLPRDRVIGQVVMIHAPQERVRWLR